MRSLLPLLAVSFLAPACSGGSSGGSADGGTQADDGGDGASTSEKLCLEGGLCFEFPLPHGLDIQDIHGTSESDVWAVGDRGTIIHRGEDGKWLVVASPVDVRLHAVFAVATDQAWAVGEEGVILRWTGSTWKEVDSPTEMPLRDVLVDGDGAIVAVGGDADGGVVVRGGEDAWSVDSVTCPDLYAVVRPEGGALWIGGGSTLACIARQDGGSWTVDFSLDALHLHDPLGTVIDMASSGANIDAIVRGVGLDHLVRYSGGAWSYVSEHDPRTLAALASSGAGVWAAGAAVTRIDGTSSCGEPVGGYLLGLWSAPDGPLFGAGKGGFLAQLSGQTGCRESSNGILPGSLWTIRQAAGGALWAAQGNLVYRFGADGWEVVSEIPFYLDDAGEYHSEDIVGLGACGADEAVALVTSNVENVPFLFRIGASSQTMEVGLIGGDPKKPMHDVWCDDATNVWYRVGNYTNAGWGTSKLYVQQAGQGAIEDSGCFNSGRFDAVSASAPFPILDPDRLSLIEDGQCRVPTIGDFSGLPSGWAVAGAPGDDLELLDGVELAGGTSAADPRLARLAGDSIELLHRESGTWQVQSLPLHPAVGDNPFLSSASSMEAAGQTFATFRFLGSGGPGPNWTAAVDGSGQSAILLDDSGSLAATDDGSIRVVLTSGAVLRSE